MDIDSILNRVDTDLDASLDRLFELLKIPSISTDPAYTADCRRTAEFLAADLATLGLSAEVRDTIGHPIVLAKSDGPDNRPHILFYGHYDVQPVDPLELWETDPFAPRMAERPDGSKMIVARGAADDKGQVMTFVEALRAIKAVEGELPVKVTIMLEGEEESGSPSLPGFFAEAKDELQADAVFVCDTGMWDRDTPAITMSLRGNITITMTVRAADRDLHSGYFGGAARNPNSVVAKILAGLHDDAGRVTLPGFYDGVHEVDPRTLANWDSLGMTAGQFLGTVGLSRPAGEEGRSILELVWSRPTCEVNGMSGGYSGAGFKTVIPAEAQAKVSFRLVGTQDPDKIIEAFKAYARELVPADCSVEFETHGSGPAIQVPADWPMLKTAQKVLAEEWQTQTAMIGVGGSIPIVHDFKTVLGMDALLIGFGLEDDRVHSPNEKYDLKSFHKGIRSWARLLAAL
ncbi:MAG: dipeptidase [Pseudomonadota bacterium]